MNIVGQSKHLMLHLGAAPIMWLMIALSIASLAVIVERAFFFQAIRDDVELLARVLSERLHSRDFEGARVAMETSPSAEAAVVLAGILASPRGANAARESMAGAASAQRVRLERRLAFLGTLGSNAPFIGLFGTVIGIVMAFDALGKAGAAAAPTGVMSAIAEALVATAIGLAVAIPAVAAYNVFQRRIKVITAHTDTLTRVLLSHLETSPSADSKRGAA